MNELATLIIRPFAVVAAAWLILRIFRVQHPASQHTVWSVALAGMLIIAPLSFVMPRWSLALWPVKPIPVLHAAQETKRPIADGGHAVAKSPVIPAFRSHEEPNRFPISETLLLLVYVFGAAATISRQLIGRFLLKRLICRAKPVVGCVRESNDVVVPVTSGLSANRIVANQLANVAGIDARFCPQT